MKLTAFFLFVFSVILMLGGVGGFFQKIGGASILVGALVGLTLLICSFFVLKKKIKWGLLSILLVMGISALFTYQFYQTHHFYPYGVMSAFSLLVFISLIASFLKEWRNEE